MPTNSSRRLTIKTFALLCRTSGVGLVLLTIALIEDLLTIGTPALLLAALWLVLFGVAPIPLYVILCWLLLYCFFVATISMRIGVLRDARDLATQQRRYLIARRLAGYLESGQPLRGRFILFLRSFDADASWLMNIDNGRADRTRDFALLHMPHEGRAQIPPGGSHLEDLLSEWLSPWGDLVALSNPLEKPVNDIPAEVVFDDHRLRRLSPPEQVWKDWFVALVSAARAVVVVPLFANLEAVAKTLPEQLSALKSYEGHATSTGEGFRYEIRTLVSASLCNKLVLIFPPHLEPDQAVAVSKELAELGLTMSDEPLVPSQQPLAGLLVASFSHNGELAKVRRMDVDVVQVIERQRRQSLREILGPPNPVRVVLSYLQYRHPLNMGIWRTPR